MPHVRSPPGHQQGAREGEGPILFRQLASGRKRLVEVSLGAVEIGIDVEIDVAQEAMRDAARPAILRRDPERAPVARLGVVAAAELAVQDSGIDPQLGVMRVERLRLLAVGERVGEAVHGHLDDAALAQGAAVIRIERERAVEDVSIRVERKEPPRLVVGEAEVGAPAASGTPARSTTAHMRAASRAVVCGHQRLRHTMAAATAPGAFTTVVSASPIHSCGGLEATIVGTAGDDILTGTQPDGRAYTDAADHTCSNWTSSAEGQGSAWVGHADRYSFQVPGSPWNSSHGTPGCSPQNLISVGGAGLFYCFAAD